MSKLTEEALMSAEQLHDWNQLDPATQKWLTYLDQERGLSTAEIGECLGRALRVEKAVAERKIRIETLSDGSGVITELDA